MAVSLINTAYVQNMRKVAEDAWDAGDRHFTPILGTPVKMNNSSAVIDWPHMIDAIEHAGWHLHTWAVTNDGGRSIALPLFIRP